MIYAMEKLLWIARNTGKLSRRQLKEKHPLPSGNKAAGASVIKRDSSLKGGVGKDSGQQEQPLHSENSAVFLRIGRRGTG